MIRIVQILVTSKMPRENAFMLEAQGKLVEHRSRIADYARRGEEDLNDAINEGFTLLCSHVMEDDSGGFIVYTLYAPDAVDDTVQLTEAAERLLALEDVKS